MSCEFNEDDNEDDNENEETARSKSVDEAENARLNDL